MVDVGNAEVEWAREDDVGGRDFGEQMKWDDYRAKKDLFCDWALKDKLDYFPIR